MIAAKRAGVKTVVLPNDNRKDFDDLPDLIKADVEVHFAENYDQVFKIACVDKFTDNFRDTSFNYY